MSMLSFLLNPKIQKTPDEYIQKNMLCSEENSGNDVELTPIRKARKRDFHANNPIVKLCRSLYLENKSVMDIAILTDVDVHNLIKWEKNGWLVSAKRRKRKPAVIE